MACIPPSSWPPPPPPAPNRATSSRSAVFPSVRFRSLKPLLASSADGKPEAPDAVKLALAKAAAYKKSATAKSNPSPASAAESLDPISGSEGSGGDSGGPEIPASVKLAMERAREYKKETIISGQKEMASNSKAEAVENKTNKKEALKVSSTDFLGFGFSDKKRYRGPPPGLMQSVEPFFQGDAPDVEIIVGDTSKFDVTTPSEISSDKVDDEVGLYKPKVSTWGVFPRPSNISKTFGGGKIIRPGEDQETAEEKVAKDKRTKELIAAYKNKMGLTIDAKTKAECEKAFKEGDKLMDRGNLREALPFYEKVMKDLVFQSELHGLAALQWSVCQDSLCRTNEARSMYEKLQSHPNVRVSKQARQFVFSFKAMEMMKVKISSYPQKTGYEDYFRAFIGNEVNYTPQEEEEVQDEGSLRVILELRWRYTSCLFIIWSIHYWLPGRYIIYHLLLRDYYHREDAIYQELITCLELTSLSGAYHITCCFPAEW